MFRNKAERGEGTTPPDRPAGALSRPGWLDTFTDVVLAAILPAKAHAFMPGAVSASWKVSWLGLRLGEPLTEALRQAP